MSTTIDGHVPNYVNPVSRVPEFLGVQISMTSLALIVVCLRLYTRRYIRHLFDMEDWVIVAATVMATVATIVSCCGVLGGTGLHYYDLPKDIDKSIAASTSFVNQVLYQPILQTTKISMLLFYISCLGKGVRKPCYVLIAFAILFCIACTVVEFLQCKPIEMVWKGTRPKGYKCINQKQFFEVTGAINLASDVLALIVPAPVIWKLQAPLRTRIALCLIFAVGLISMTAEAARLVIWFSTRDGNRTNPDSTWNRVSIVNWSCIEYTTGIICVSLPHLKAFVTKVIPGFFGTSRGASRPYHSGADEINRAQNSRPDGRFQNSGLRPNNSTHHSHISSTDKKGASRLTDNDSEEYILESMKHGPTIMKTTEWRCD